MLYVLTFAAYAIGLAVGFSWGRTYEWFQRDGIGDADDANESLWSGP